MHYLLYYETSPDYLEGRPRYRDEHLRLAWAAHGRGELLLGGALADPVDGAVLLFQGNSSKAAEEFAAADPYVRCGLVTRWYIRPWSMVVGAAAAAPNRPGTWTGARRISTLAACRLRRRRLRDMIGPMAIAAA